MASGSAWSITSQFIFSANQMLVFWVLALILVPAQLGLYQYVASTLALFSMFSVGAFGGLANKFVAELKERDRVRTGRILALSWSSALLFAATVAALTMLLARRVAIDLCKTPEVEGYLKLGAAALLGMGLLGVARGVLAGLRAFNIQAIGYGWLTLTSVPLIGGGAYGWGLEGAVAGMVINYILGGLFCAWLSLRTWRRQDLKVVWSRFTSEWRLLGTFWLPSMLAVLVSAPGVMLVQAMLLREPWGATELGFFSPSYVIHHAVGMVPAAISPVMLTLLSEVSSGDQDDRFQAVYSMQLRAVWMVTLVMSVMVICASRGILLLFKPVYAWTWPYLAMLAGVALLKAVNGTAEQVLASKRRQWLRFTNSCVWVLVMLVTAWLLVPVYGPGGAALAYLLGHGTNTILNFLALRLGLGIRLDAMTRRLFLLTAGFLVLAEAVAVYGDWVGGLLGSVVLAMGAAWAMWRCGLDAGERDRLRGLVVRRWGRVAA